MKLEARYVIFAVLPAVIALSDRTAEAQEPAAPLAAKASVTTPLTDTEVEERIAYICQELEAGETYANIWQWGWVGIFGASAVGGGVMAGVQWDTKATRANMMAMVAKSTLAMTMLLVQPLKAASSPSALRSLLSNTHANRQAVLIEAERLLALSADDARRKTTWLMHAINFLVNSVAFAATYAYLQAQPKNSDAYAARYKTPLTGFLLGFASTELEIFLTPTRTRDAWRDYLVRYSP